MVFLEHRGFVYDFLNKNNLEMSCFPQRIFHMFTIVRPPEIDLFVHRYVRLFLPGLLI